MKFVNNKRFNNGYFSTLIVCKRNENDETPISRALEKHKGPQLVVLVWNTEIYYLIRKSPPPDPILGQRNPVHIQHIPSFQVIRLILYISVVFTMYYACLAHLIRGTQ
jgi:hypothetical protein